MVTHKKKLSAHQGATLALVALLAVTGCGTRKAKKKNNLAKQDQVAYNKSLFKTVDIPLSPEDQQLLADNNNEVSSFFDEGTQDFVAYDTRESDGNKESLDILSLAADEVSQFHKKQDYAWIDADHTKEFKTVYFDFDKHIVRPDQKDIVETDITAARKILDEARSTGENPIVVIEGHACHSAGSSTYNTALSGKRAVAVRDFFIQEGVPAENIKIVERGSDFPVVASGNRDEQWPNRRVEVRVIYS